MAGDEKLSIFAPRYAWQSNNTAKKSSQKPSQQPSETNSPTTKGKTRTSRPVSKTSTTGYNQTSTEAINFLKLNPGTELKIGDLTVVYENGAFYRIVNGKKEKISEKELKKLIREALAKEIGPDNRQNKKYTYGLVYRLLKILSTLKALDVRGKQIDLVALADKGMAIDGGDKQSKAEKAATCENIDEMPDATDIAQAKAELKKAVESEDPAAIQAAIGRIEATDTYQQNHNIYAVEIAAAKSRSAVYATKVVTTSPTPPPSGKPEDKKGPKAEYPPASANANARKNADTWMRNLAMGYNNITDSQLERFAKDGKITYKEAKAMDLSDELIVLIDSGMNANKAAKAKGSVKKRVLSRKEVEAYLKARNAYAKKYHLKPEEADRLYKEAGSFHNEILSADTEQRLWGEFELDENDSAQEFSQAMKMFGIDPEFQAVVMAYSKAHPKATAGKLMTILIRCLSAGYYKPSTQKEVFEFTEPITAKFPANGRANSENELAFLRGDEVTHTKGASGVRYAERDYDYGGEDEEVDMDDLREANEDLVTANSLAKKHERYSKMSPALRKNKDILQQMFDAYLSASQFETAYNYAGQLKRHDGGKALGMLYKKVQGRPKYYEFAFNIARKMFKKSTERDEMLMPLYQHYLSTNQFPDALNVAINLSEDAMNDTLAKFASHVFQHRTNDAHTKLINDALAEIKGDPTIEWGREKAPKKVSEIKRSLAEEIWKKAAVWQVEYQFLSIDQDGRSETPGDKISLRGSLEDAAAQLETLDRVIDEQGNKPSQRAYALYVKGMLLYGMACKIEPTEKVTVTRIDGSEVELTGKDLYYEAMYALRQAWEMSEFADEASQDDPDKQHMNDLQRNIFIAQATLGDRVLQAGKKVQWDDKKTSSSKVAAELGDCIPPAEALNKKIATWKARNKGQAPYNPVEFRNGMHAKKGFYKGYTSKLGKVEGEHETEKLKKAAGGKGEETTSSSNSKSAKAKAGATAALSTDTKI